MGPVRQALREATRDIHERLDRAAVLRPLTSPSITADEYRDALIALHGFNAPIERALGEGAERLDLLRADLADLGVDADSLPVAGSLPALDGLPARLAARYVLDGSAHGGRAMLPNVTRALGFDATRGARFLASAGIDMAGRWKALLARLESDLDTPESAQAACATAVALFAALEVWLDGLAAKGA
ncbi:heme oxygenase [Azospirillum brasilense]|uniref:Heme oxygenase n=1 Tax=Azospirillum brasilense TaxID=192 RepID=A0A0P0FDW1_AZOBR|nr:MULTISPECIES: biliverdin-producing heme oxygenase [Azospirillum]ALJ37880.1 heme oxygenase [Azospirillum brasilense]MDW7554792.1 biliverdin-producing heme oxygenase [Azospirillum brasilense]MDW7597131.1 biliverdin-producing heme oxygenase [Azospirillum brasilense]MDW7632046.1 biliverdin-producing heme oxygenase [Azospirillum brasilense]MDX5951911.1 biliverdin-producing heme oxygenase [Azospirillum brasilense]